MIKLKQDQFGLKGTLLVGLSGCLYGSIGFLGTKLFQQGFSVTSMSFWRFFVASLWILFNNPGLFKRLTQVPKLSSVVICALFYSISSAQFFFASLYIGTGSAMVIFFSFPIFVALFALLIENIRLDKFAIAAILLVVIGLILLHGAGIQSLNLNGILIAISAAFFYACYIYYSKKNVKENTQLFSFYICLSNTFIFFLMMLLTHSFKLPTTLSAFEIILTIAIIGTALPIKLLLDGMQYIGPLKASILSVFEPLITVILGILLLGEQLTSIQLAGIAIILLSAVSIQFHGEEETDIKARAVGFKKNPLAERWERGFF